jgi:hypothetical protein
MNKDVSTYLKKIGKKGGEKSRRTLDSKTAKLMVKVRVAKKAYVKYHSKCFWSYDPNLKITSSDIKWVGEQLMKNGQMDMWELGVRLCQ